MSRLAIVISAVGSTESLEGTLVSVLENRPRDCEVIVALQHAYADPYELKDEVRFIAPQRSEPIVGAINRALATTRAPFVHLLAAGCQVTEGWADAALAGFGDRRVAAISPLVWDAADEKRLLAAGVGYRRRGERYLVGSGLETLSADTRQLVIGPAAFAAFYRKAALDFVGGFSSALGLKQADADLALMLKQAGFKATTEPRCEIRAITQVDHAAGALSDALAEERLFWRNLSGPGSAWTVLAHAGLVGVDLARSFPRPRLAARLAGRAWAYLGFGTLARHRRAMVALASHAVRETPPEHVRIDRSHTAPARIDPSRKRVSAS